MEKLDYKDLEYPSFLPNELKGKKDFWIGANDPFSILLVVEGPSVDAICEVLQSGQGLFINFKRRSAEMHELEYSLEELCPTFIYKVYQGQHGEIHFLACTDVGINGYSYGVPYPDTIWVWDYD